MRPSRKKMRQPPPGLVGPVGEVVMNAGGEIRGFARRLAGWQVDDQRQRLVERVLVGGVDDVLLGILVEVTLVKGRRIE